MKKLQLERLKHRCHAESMVKKKAAAKRPADVNQLAHFLGKQATGEVEPPTTAEISRVMAELGRRGGKIGGKKRLVTLTQEQRSQIAFKAARARWSKKAKPQ